MHTHPASRRVLAAVLLAGAFPLLSAAAAPVPSAPDADAAVNPAEKVRQGLDRVVSIRFDRQMMPEALAELGDKAKLHIVLDGPAAQQFGIAPGQLQVPVQADLNGVKARTALRTLLDPYNLTFVTVGGEVVVATQDGAVGRQMSQRVSVHLDKIDCAAALKQIARETGVNLALDPRGEGGVGQGEFTGRRHPPGDGGAAAVGNGRTQAGARGRYVVRDHEEDRRRDARRPRLDGAAARAGPTDGCGHLSVWERVRALVLLWVGAPGRRLVTGPAISASLHCRRWPTAAAPPTLPA